MANVLLLHSALGLRPGVLALAEDLSARGHTVVTPDFYDGLVFEEDTEGTGYRDRVGGRRLLDRVVQQVGDLPEDAALAGLSLGAAFAQHLARERPRARAVVLLHHASAPRGPWPGRPVQVHRYERDSWIDPAEVQALGRAVRESGAPFEDLVVPGEGHLFTDPGLPDYDEVATRRAVASIDRMLTGLDA